MIVNVSQLLAGSHNIFSLFSICRNQVRMFFSLLRLYRFYENIILSSPLTPLPQVIEEYSNSNEKVVVSPSKPSKMMKVNYILLCQAIMIIIAA